MLHYTYIKVFKFYAFTKKLCDTTVALTDHKSTYVTLYIHDIKVFGFYALIKKLCDTTVALL